LQSYKTKKVFEDRECVVCGKIFTPTHSRQITCSAECRKEQSRFRDEIKGIKMKNCIVCGKEFISVNGRQTCSAECLKIRQAENTDNPHCFWKRIKKKAEFRKKAMLDSSTQKH